MALINSLKETSLEKDSQHSETECTYTIINSGGESFLQIDTYGSIHRKFPGKKSQSLRFSRSAAMQLKDILSTYFS